MGTNPIPPYVCICMERQGGLPRAGIAWTPEGVEETIHMAMAGRKDWVQADLRCLMCGRVIGRLVGPVPVDKATVREAAGRWPHFAAFRPADTSVPAVRLVGDERFRCTTCGGGVIMDELERF